MNPTTRLRDAWLDFLSALQFLTRIPMPSRSYKADSLARSVNFFSIVGLFVGGGAALLHFFLVPHLSRMATALIVVSYFVLVTGGLHEDGLADAADGFGGGVNHEKILLIMRDSRIGSYGGLALGFSLLGRMVLIASMPLQVVTYYLMVASLLSRWTVLPLSYFLSSARPSTTTEVSGLGARIASHTSTSAVLFGTVISFSIAAALLKTHAIVPILSATFLTWFTGAYYNRRIGGATGDCFGATIQLVEIGCYLCGAWAA